MATDWERRLADWQAELELIAQLEDIHWVPLGRAEAEDRRVPLDVAIVVPVR